MHTVWQGYNTHSKSAPKPLRKVALMSDQGRLTRVCSVEILLLSQALLDCNVVSGYYRYLMDLLALNSCRQVKVVCISPASEWHSICRTPPVLLPIWESTLRSHPDQRFASYILNGFHLHRFPLFEDEIFMLPVKRKSLFSC